MPYQEGSSTDLQKNKIHSCLIGCLVAIVLAVVLLVGGYYWMAAPGPQVPTDRFAGPDSLALIHVEGLGNDPGLAALLRRLAVEQQNSEMQRESREEVRWLVKILGSRGRRDEGEKIDEALGNMPRDVTLTLESVQESNPSWVAAVNLARFPRLFRLGFWAGSFFLETEEFNGFQIMKIDPEHESAVTFVGHTLLWAEDQATLEHVLQRYLTAAQPEGDGLLAAYTIRESRWNLFGVVANRNDSLAWLAQRAFSLLWKNQADSLNRAALVRELQKIEYMQLGVDVVEENILEALLKFDCYTSKEARELREKVQLSADMLRPMWEKEGLEVRLSYRLESRSVVVHARVEGLVEMMVEKIDSAKMKVDREN